MGVDERGRTLCDALSRAAGVGWTLSVCNSVLFSVCGGAKGHTQHVVNNTQLLCVCEEGGGGRGCLHSRCNYGHEPRATGTGDFQAGNVCASLTDVAGPSSSSKVEVDPPFVGVGDVAGLGGLRRASAGYGRARPAWC